MKNVVTVSALLWALCLVFCGCSMPYAEKTIPSNKTTYFNIYVSGAVENDGYFSFVAGSDYKEVLTKAGELPATYCSNDLSRLLTRDVREIILDYKVNGVTFYSVNVNGILITSRSPVDNVEPRIVDMLADYIESNGKITNRIKLRQALGEYYEDNFYKFFISEQDYA